MLITGGVTIFNLLIEVMKNSALIAIVAYLLIHTRSLRRALEGTAKGKDKLLLAMVFSLLSVAGNYLGIPVMGGALANNRIVAPVVGGLLVGPEVGIVAGLIGGIHRLFLGGFTAEACAVGNIAVGILGSLIYLKRGPTKINGKVALVTGFIAELIVKAIVLIMAKPFSSALALEKMIAVPTILANTLGIAIFVTMVQSVRFEHLKVGASYAEQALNIASQTLPILRQGLTSQAAFKVASLILQETKVAAVAITDREHILAFVGSGSEHHKTGSPILTPVTRQVIGTGLTQVVLDKETLACPHPGCSLHSAVIVPLYIRDEIIGSFCMFKANGEEISPAERKLAEGISNLLSLQLEVAQLNEQSKLLARAEFAALKAQVNPHFLFNTLSVIMSCCRSNPEEARELLVHLSHLLRRRLRENDDFVPLREELEAINEYLAIIKVRFGDRLRIKIAIQEETMDCLIPVFSVQPLVENAIRHGLLAKEDNCYLELKAFLKTDHTLQVEVYDNGVGITPEVLERIKLGIKSSNGGVGLTNIMQRLKLLYGERGSCTLKTAVGEGTRAILVLPRI